MDRELRRLQDHFDQEYGYKAATRIREPNVFARWLGIDFALKLDKSTDVRPGALDEIGYALGRYDTNLRQGSGSIDTVVYVHQGPERAGGWRRAVRRGAGRNYAEWRSGHGTAGCMKSLSARGTAT